MIEAKISFLVDYIHLAGNICEFLAGRRLTTCFTDKGMTIFVMIGDDEKDEFRNKIIDAFDFVDDVSYE